MTFRAQRNRDKFGCRRHCMRRSVNTRIRNWTEVKFFAEGAQSFNKNLRCEIVHRWKLIKECSIIQWGLLRVKLSFCMMIYWEGFEEPLRFLEMIISAQDRKKKRIHKDNCIITQFLHITCTFNPLKCKLSNFPANAREICKTCFIFFLAFSISNGCLGQILEKCSWINHVLSRGLGQSR